MENGNLGTIKPYPNGTRVALGKSLAGWKGRIGILHTGATPRNANREPYYYTFNADNGQSFTIGHSEVDKVL